MPAHRHKKWFEELQPSLNLMPLLDVLFNLIFFFILATTIKESQSFLNISLPFSEQAQVSQQKPPESLVIMVNANNEVTIRGEAVALENLASKLKDITQLEKIQQVVVRGDAKAYHQTIIEVLDACAETQLYKVSVEVIPKSIEE